MLAEIMDKIQKMPTSYFTNIGVTADPAAIHPPSTKLD
jgi:hypothetical protein